MEWLWCPFLQRGVKFCLQVQVGMSAAFYYLLFFPKFVKLLPHWLKNVQFYVPVGRGRDNESFLEDVAKATHLVRYWRFLEEVGSRRFYPRENVLSPTE